MVLPLSRRVVLLAAGGLLAGCSRQPEAGEVRLRLATGPAGAVYRRIGGALAERITEQVPGVTVTTVPSGASTDNIRMLRAERGAPRTVEPGRGGHRRRQRARGAVRGVLGSTTATCTSWSWLSSDIDDFGDVEGRRVSLGARDSGTEFTSLRVLKLGRVNVDGRYLSQAESAAALRDGGLDAMFSLTGVPTPAIADLAQRHPVRLIPLGGQADALVTAYPSSYTPATISATAYAGVPATRTVAVPNVLLARNDLPHDLVYSITETIFVHTGSIASGAEAVPEAWQINVRTGISTASIPLHPGAAAWFRDRKR
nr:TAXI family TRAP transporter solute-binding subunit [Actinoplanes digitatis]